MKIYAGLFDFMLAWCARTWLRHGPIYTVAMIALALTVSLNVLSLVDLLWIAGVLHDPYRSAGQFHPQRYVLAVLSVVFIANSLLARRLLSAEIRPIGLTPRGPPGLRRLAAPAYVLGSAATFLSTLPQ